MNYKKVFPESLYDKCYNFAKQVGGDYSTRNQFNTNKAQIDHTCAKISECFVYLYLTDELKLKGIKPPDFGIYPPNEKSWDADLYIKDKPLHVKSISNWSKESLGCETYTFQNSDPKRGFGRDSVLDNPNDLLACVFVDFIARTCELRVFQRVGNILPLLKDPLKQELKGIKKCLYYDDIKSPIAVSDCLR